MAKSMNTMSTETSRAQFESQQARIHELVAALVSQQGDDSENLPLSRQNVPLSFESSMCCESSRAQFEKLQAHILDLVATLTSQRGADSVPLLMSPRETLPNFLKDGGVIPWF